MRRLYVGNLPWSTTEEELSEHFGQHGELKAVRIITDKETKQSRGFAFVEYVDEDSAAKACAAEDGKEFGGRELRVREAEDRRPPREPRSAGSSEDRHGGNGNGNGHHRRDDRPRGGKGGDRRSRKTHREHR